MKETLRFCIIKRIKTGSVFKERETGKVKCKLFKENMLKLFCYSGRNVIKPDTVVQAFY